MLNFVFPLGGGTGQTDRQTDRQDQHMMGPPFRKNGPIIIRSSNLNTHLCDYSVVQSVRQTCCSCVRSQWTSPASQRDSADRHLHPLDPVHNHRPHLPSIHTAFRQQAIHSLNLYRVRQKNVAPSSFSLFSQQPFSILIWKLTDLFTKLFYGQMPNKIWFHWKMTKL